LIGPGCTIEGLEGRTLLSATFLPEGKLQLVGSPTETNNVVLSYGAGSEVVVEQWIGSRYSRLQYTNVKEVSVTLGDNTDVFDNRTNIFSRVFGNGGRDTLYGGSANDDLHGGNGNDFIDGRGGADRIYGDAGADYLRGGSGSDLMYGGSGDDSLFGGGGGDWLYGEDGNDRLYGEAGSDRLYGGSGINIVLRWAETT
jgi:Ca2+-binding RTX toxin-like protein